MEKECPGGNRFNQVRLESGSRVEFNVPPNTLWVISGTIFMGEMTQPTVESGR